MEFQLYKLFYDLPCVAARIEHPHPALLLQFFIFIVFNLLIFLEYPNCRTVSQEYLKHRHSIFKFLILVRQYADDIPASAFLKHLNSLLILSLLLIFGQQSYSRLFKIGRVIFLITLDFRPAWLGVDWRLTWTASRGNYITALGGLLQFFLQFSFQI